MCATGPGSVSVDSRPCVYVCGWAGEHVVRNPIRVKAAAQKTSLPSPADGAAIEIRAVLTRSHYSPLYAMVTTAIPLRFDGRSTAIRLAMKGP